MSDQERITKVLTVADEKTVPSYANPPPNSTAENSLRQTAHPGDRTTKGSIREETIRDTLRKDHACRPVRLNRRSGVCSDHAPGGTSSRPPKIGSSGSDAAGKNRKHFVYGELHCKGNIRRPPFHCVKNRLQSDLTAVYNPRTIHRVCTAYSWWRFSISCSVPSHGNTRILFFDEFVRYTPAGRQRGKVR